MKVESGFNNFLFVTPAKAGAQLNNKIKHWLMSWIPAFAGMTGLGAVLHV